MPGAREPESSKPRGGWSHVAPVYWVPPPPAAEVSVAQLTVLLELEEPAEELDEELDEQPAASSDRAANPANANRYGNLTRAS